MIMQPDIKVSQDSFIPVEGPSPILRLLASQVCSTSDVLMMYLSLFFFNESTCRRGGFWVLLISFCSGGGTLSVVE